MGMFNINHLFAVPLISTKFENHYKYKFPQFPRKEKVPCGWTTPLYTSYPNIQPDDENIDYNTVCSLKDDLKTEIDHIFEKIDIPTNWYFGEFWYNYYYENQGQERHAHIPLSGSILPYWSGIYYNLNPTPTTFHNPNNLTIFHRFENCQFSKINNFFWEYWNPDVEEGTLILFPPYLQHHVSYVKNSNMALTFSFNIYMSRE